MEIGSVHINPYCCFVGWVLVDVESDVETKYRLMPGPAYLSTLAVCEPVRLLRRPVLVAFYTPACKHAHE